ncbi:phage tail spike protein, partial [Sutcliffiella cohnii]
PETSNLDLTEEELTRLTEIELAKRVNAVVEYRGDIADLESVPGMEDKKIRFGDTIKIKDTKFNPALYLEARVHTQERDIVDKSKKHVEL